MDTFIARQPIFDDKLNVYAYELLYRSGEENFSNATDGDAATFSVIKNSLMSIGLETLTDGKLAFINFTKKLIEDKIPTVFSEKEVVVEILEDIVPDENFIQKCLELKEAGYIIALDDFVLEYEYEEVIKLADIIKVDFMLTTEYERKRIYEKYKKYDIDFLAEKVETLADYKTALKTGFKYFQGYFFSKPVIMKGTSIQALSVNYLRIINELERNVPEINNITEIIEADVSLTYKLLRYINSTGFYQREKIQSVHHALVYLGLKEIKKWITIAMIQDLGDDKPDEIVRNSLIRGKMAELLADSYGLRGRKSELFLVGMLSMIDTLMNCSKEFALKQLPLAEDVKEGIVGGDNIFSKILEEIIDYEQGHWMALGKKNLKNLNKFPEAYFKAVQWTRAIYDEQS